MKTYIPREGVDKYVTYKDLQLKLLSRKHKWHRVIKNPRNLHEHVKKLTNYLFIYLVENSIVFYLFSGTTIMT